MIRVQREMWGTGSPRLVYVALRTPPMPERLLKLRLA